MGFNETEFCVDWAPKCPCILLLDTSGSMSDQPIAALNEGLQVFKSSVCEDSLAAKCVEVAIVTFGNGGVQLKQPFISMNDFVSPVLSAGGVTLMGEAINLALDNLRERKDWYKSIALSFFRPWVFLITAGGPADNWKPVARRVHQEESARTMSFFAVGVEGANMTTLGEISVRPPVMLQGLDFNGMFQWLAKSLIMTSRSKIGESLALPAIGWAPIRR